MNRRASESGMTLIEAMVALFIMALASSMIVLSMPPRPAPIEVAIYRLADLAETARSAALVKGSWTGIVQEEEERYRLVTFQNGDWVASRSPPVRIEGELQFEQERERGDTFPIFQFGPTGTARADKLTLQIGVNERSVSVARDGAIAIGEGR